MSNTRYLRQVMYISVWAAFVSGCSTERAETNPALVSRDTLPGGATRLRYGAMPFGDVIRAEMDLRIGEVDGDSNLVFGDVRGIDAAEDGTIFVLDYLASEVKAYDDAGRFLRKVVTKGGGPGEIREANGIQLAGDSILWIQDHGQWMMIGVDLAGEERLRFPMPVRTYGYTWMGMIDNRGRVLKLRSHSDAPRVFPPPEGLTEGSAREYLMAYDPIEDALDSAYIGDAAFRAMIFRNNAGGFTYRPVPHDPRPITAIDPDGGMWRTDAGAYRIARLDDRGDTVLVIESETEAPPVTADDRAAYVEDIVEQDPAERRVAEEVTALMRDTKPVISGLLVDDEGRLWVRRAGDADTTRFDIFDRKGAYHGTVEMGFTVPAYSVTRIRHGRLYTMVRDELEVPYVVRTGPLPFET